MDAVLHCGDFVAPFALLPYADLACKRLYAVFGNVDGEKKGISHLAELNKWQLSFPPMDMEIGGRDIIMLHEPDRLDEFVSKNSTDLIVYGHLHRPLAENRNGVLVLNPGEGGGWTTGKATLAIVDLETMKAEFLPINL